MRCNGLGTIPLTLVVAGWLVLHVPAAVSAQPAADSPDSRWVPWLGCWQLVADIVQHPALLRSPGGDRETPPPEERLVCVTAGPQGGAEISTYANGDLVFEETLFADGARRPVSVSGCRGHQLTEWSSDGARLFFRSEMSCEDGGSSSFSGVSFFRRWNTWVDIQALDSGAEREVVIRRYRPASPEAASKLGFESLSPEGSTAASAARAAISRPLTIDDVIEAHSKIEPEALEAAMMESGTSFDLDSKTLLRLADSGVSPDLIDLMLALSFPERFAVSRETAGRSGGGLGYTYGGFGPFNYWDAFYFAPFGYYYWYTPYRTFFVSRPIVIPDDGVSGGRLVKGRAYTRVDRSSTASGHARRRGSGSTGTSKASSSSSSGSASSKGYSKGGSSSSRTAKPKNPKN
jgi:hypothetical protein